MVAKDLPFSNPHPTYRPDIDGIRAIAVLLVVMFHAFPSQIQGGFVGVDVFFVISGYLISSIILKGLEQGNFSYRDFYIRRIKRIFPALIVVLTTCMIFGWFVLLQDEYRSLGKHVASGAGFVSNFIFWGEAGYFDTAANFKPLLHLWSLGIEEQFYIVWPLLLVLLWKRIKNLLLALGVISLISFLLNVGLIGTNPVAAFYLPLARFWELMLGSMLAYASLFRGDIFFTISSNFGIRQENLQNSKRFISEACSLFGMLLVISAAALVDKDSEFPGWWALMPTVGTVLLIAAGPLTWLNSKVLSHRSLVLLGLISYPLYLWHWPILSIANIVNYGAPALWIRIGAIAASIVMAWLVYKMVEKPIQARQGNFAPTILSVLILIISTAGYYIYHNEGLTFRAVNKSGNLKKYTESIKTNADIHARYITDDCKYIANLSSFANSICKSYGPNDKDAIVVWGDSHADAWAPVFFEAAKENNIRIILFSHVGCPPLIGVRRTDGFANSQNCASLDTGEDIINAIQTIRPKHVYMVARWSVYTNGFLIEGKLHPATHFITTDPYSEANIDSSKRALESQLFKTLQLLTDDFPVTVFRTTPVLKTHIGKGLVRNLPMEPTLEEHRNFEAVSDKALDEALKRLGDLDVIDPAALLCGQTCKAVINGTVYYLDDNHVSAQGAMQFKEIILDKYSGNIAHEDIRGFWQ